MLCGLTWLASLDGWPDILGGTGRPSIQSSTRPGVTGLAWGLALPFPLFSSSARPPANRSPPAGFIGKFHGRELNGGDRNRGVEGQVCQYVSISVVAVALTKKNRKSNIEYTK